MGDGIDVIAITGGPHAGKSTLLDRLPKAFEDLGYTVEVLPEVATQLMLEGINPADDLYEFQRLVLSRCIRQEEEAKTRMHAIPGRKVIFADRGVMDGLAYIDSDSMRAIWDEFGHHIVELRDRRYAGVIYLESTGVSLPHLFSNASNETRYEKSPQEAAATCGRTLAAWIGCPHLGYVDNSTDFEEKMVRAITWARYFLESVENERKFRLLVPFDRGMLPAHAQCVEIRQSYVRIPGGSQPQRIRMRGQDKRFVHFQTLKRGTGGISCREEEKQIHEREYAHLHGTARIPGHEEIVKERWCFVANGRYWELDVFRDWSEDVLLEVELPDPDWPVPLPLFLEGKVLEVTGEREFSNREIARKIAQLKAQ